MIDPTPSTGRPEPEGKDGPAPARPPNAGFGPAYALIRATLGDRVPTGPLGQDTVPPEVLSLPIALATEDLVQHAKRCKNPRCTHLPVPLRSYRHMRPEAIRKAANQVHKVLWARLLSTCPWMPCARRTA